MGYLGNDKSTDYTAIANDVYYNPENNNSIKIFGSANPTWFGAINNTINWRNISLNFNIIYKLGYYSLKQALSYSGLAIRDATYGINYNQRWMKPGDEQHTSVPSLIYPLNVSRGSFYQTSEINVIKADHIRLQYVNLFYNINKISKKQNCTLQLFINAANLGILWRANKDHIDPDSIKSIPAPKTYTLGIRLHF
ncbi:hypothetical protein FSB73_11670 [Arachidicoccus ginsenosidivorans]|uniref:TonB-dependent receptor n=1 Tax=Arachidicoccus ginsenosidivorans TaxID=496057 RepID=A0A5B8VM19_9BACT|nr:hypothetical protein [Arachidicoccus ginsenosidivorans]QEC72233.1 hypothetical protein FSB73_11670 [Arachidicoccus ginsenosidivorans]